MMPDIMRQLKDEHCEKAQHYFIRSVELLHCLMQLHEGFPDLYDPILEVVKVSRDHSKFLGKFMHLEFCHGVLSICFVSIWSSIYRH